MSKPEKFWWFRGASVEELARRLERAGPSACRLEVRISEDGKMTFRVVADGTTSLAAASVEPDINESHPCPPDCIEG